MDIESIKILKGNEENEKNVNNTEIVVNLDHFTKKVVDDKQIDYLYLDNGSRCEATVIIMDSIRRDITAREALEEIAETSSRKIMTKTIKNGIVNLASELPLYLTASQVYAWNGRFKSPYIPASYPQ